MGRAANANNSAVTGREPKPWSCLCDNQAWQIISKHGEEGKTRGLFQSDTKGRRGEIEKRWGETKHCSSSATGGWGWWQGDCGLMAHPQMTTYTPSPRTSRQKGVVVKRICCFTVTAARATTMSLPQLAKTRNPRAWYSETCRRQEGVCMRVSDNERMLNGKHRKDRECVLKCDWMKCVCAGDCVPSKLSCSLSERRGDVCHTRARSVSGLGWDWEKMLAVP